MYCKKNEVIFILSGKAESGKNTISDIIEKYYGKNNCIKISYAYYIKDYLTRMGKYNNEEKQKYRSLLQEFGIDFLKTKIDSEFLINRLLDDIEVFSYFYKVIIVTDARLINEVEIPKQKFKNVITVRIQKENKNNLTASERQHITETGLDLYKDFDYTINNNSNLLDLEDKVLNMLKEYNYE